MGAPVRLPLVFSCRHCGKEAPYRRLKFKDGHLGGYDRGQPAGQRVADKVAFALEILRLYPEFARAAQAEQRTQHLADRIDRSGFEVILGALSLAG